MTLDTARNLILALPSDSCPPNPLFVTLASPAINVVVSGPHIVPVGDVAGEVQFVARRSVDGAEIVAGAVEISEAPAGTLQTLSLGEDWNSAALLMLFLDGARSVSLLGQWRWRNGGETGWNSTPWLNLRVIGSLFASGEVPGALAIGNALYLPAITSFTGHTAADLPSVPTRGVLAPGKGLIFIRLNGAAVAVYLDAGPADPDDPGQVVPDDYDAAENDVHWTRGS